MIEKRHIHYLCHTGEIKYKRSQVSGFSFLILKLMMIIYLSYNYHIILDYIASNEFIIKFIIIFTENYSVDTSSSKVF